ncbi:hypothetical protein E2P81_ATG00615 [Venturia nashicola]|nr:hypothetical protein E2P81_ATG00615 [Venturia nashicola]
MACTAWDLSWVAGPYVLYLDELAFCRPLSDIKKQSSLGKKALRHTILRKGFHEQQLEILWEFIHNLFLKTDRFLQSLYKHFQLWKKLLYLFIFYSCFSVFPNAFRHFCTTMPWTIWPSLVILWGVCWMFYRPLLGHEADPVAQFCHTSFSFELDNDTDWDSLLQSAEVIQTDDLLRNFHADPKVLGQNEELLYASLMAIPAMGTSSDFTDRPSSQAVSPSQLFGPSSPVIPCNLLPVQERAVTSASRSPVRRVESDFLKPRSAATPTRQSNQSARVAQSVMIMNRAGSRSPSAVLFPERVRTTEQENTSEQPGQTKVIRRKKITHSKYVKYFCDEPGCHRHSEGFKRRDHLRQHALGVHKKELGILRTQNSSAMGTLSPIQAPSLSADSQYLPPQSSLSAGALGKRKRDDETSILGTPNSKLAKQLFTEREIAQTLMHEMSAMRDRFQREREERDKQDRLVRDELEELRDKYFELLRAGSS